MPSTVILTYHTFWNVKRSPLSLVVPAFFFLAVFKIVPKRLRSDAPRTPHVVLFGEMGAGKSTQAAELASRYGLVNCKLVYTAM